MSTGNIGSIVGCWVMRLIVCFDFSRTQCTVLCCNSFGFTNGAALSNDTTCKAWCVGLFLLRLSRCWNMLEHSCDFFLKGCWMFKMYKLSALVHLTLQTANEFVQMLLQSDLPAPLPKLQFARHILDILKMSHGKFLLCFLPLEDKSGSEHNVVDWGWLEFGATKEEVYGILSWLCFFDIVVFMCFKPVNFAKHHAFFLFHWSVVGSMWFLSSMF